MRFRRKARALGAALSLVLSLCLAVVDAAPAPAATWAPADTATIHPGVMMNSPAGQCTANFIFTDTVDVYIGFAAHCAGTGAATDTNGCDTESLPLGTAVDIDGASFPGSLVYSSWASMQAANETDANTCQYNDFALVKIDSRDAGKVNPSIPHWGGPTGLNTTGAPFGQRVYSYGNSSLRLGITQLSPKTGVSLGTSGGGWTHPVYTATPGIPGDSGSALLDSQGRALGVLSTLAIAPIPASNNYSDLSRALSYMRAKTSLDAVQVVNGTEAFDGGRLPIGV